MTVETKHGKIGARSDETVIVGLFEGDQLPEGTPPVMDAKLRRFLTGILALEDFKGKKNQTLVLYPHDAAPPARVILVGLGARERFSLDIARQAAGTAGRRALKCGATTLVTTVHGLDIHGFSPDACAQATVEGTILGAYRYTPYKTDQEHEKRIEHLTVMYSHRTRSRAMADGAESGRITAQGAVLARDLSNAPGNALPPRTLASTANKMAKQHNLTCQILGKKAIEKASMGALMAVNQGSNEPPRFIILEHGQASEQHETIVLVGKGITFDSGGLSLKSSDRMEDMKHDMSGAAAVIGAMQAIGVLNPPLHVVGLIPATENLPDGSALKPGDIITALSGKTIEVINTDAEGRLVLADALAYAVRYRPDAVIDLATLTGACVTALGHAAAGMMGNNDDLLARVRHAAEITGERVWHLPLWEDYHDQIKSRVADVKNTGGRPAGALTAGAFLETFVEYPWVHLDIAGTAYRDKTAPYCPAGATGMGARLLIQLVMDWRK